MTLSKVLNPGNVKNFFQLSRACTTLMKANTGTVVAKVAQKAKSDVTDYSVKTIQTFKDTAKGLTLFSLASQAISTVSDLRELITNQDPTKSLDKKLLQQCNEVYDAIAQETKRLNKEFESGKAKNLAALGEDTTHLNKKLTSIYDKAIYVLGAMGTEETKNIIAQGKAGAKVILDNGPQTLALAAAQVVKLGINSAALSVDELYNKLKTSSPNISPQEPPKQTPPINPNSTNRTVPAYDANEKPMSWVPRAEKATKSLVPQNGQSR